VVMVSKATARDERCAAHPDPLRGAGMVAPTAGGEKVHRSDRRDKHEEQQSAAKSLLHADYIDWEQNKKYMPSRQRWIRTELPGREML
jgi:hypothetical protein